MTSSIKTIVALLLAISVSFGALSSASACGPYDPASSQRMWVSTLERDLEVAVVDLKQRLVIDGDVQEGLTDAVVRVLEIHRDLQEARVRLEELRTKKVSERPVTDAERIMAQK